jgi:hypothetical protein
LIFGLGALVARLRRFAFRSGPDGRDTRNGSSASPSAARGKMGVILPRKIAKFRGNFLPRQIFKIRIIDTITDVCI